MCAYHQQVSELYEIYSREAQLEEKAEFLQTTAFSSYDDTALEGFKHMWILNTVSIQPSHRGGFITSEARRGFKLIQSKWTIRS